METIVKCPTCGKVEKLFSVLPIITSAPCLRCQLKSLGRENEMIDEKDEQDEVSSL